MQTEEGKERKAVWDVPSRIDEFIFGIKKKHGFGSYRDALIHILTDHMETLEMLDGIRGESLRTKASVLLLEHSKFESMCIVIDSITPEMDAKSLKESFTKVAMHPTWLHNKLGEYEEEIQRLKNIIANGKKA